MALGKLSTKYKLHSIGVTDDTLCPLCAATSETNAHLFFDSSLNKLYLVGIRQWTRILLKLASRMDIRKYKHNKVQKLVLRAIYTLVAYYIWQSMNDAVWNGYVSRPEQIVTQIK